MSVTIPPKKLRTNSSMTANSSRPSHSTATMRPVEISFAAMSPAPLAPIYPTKTATPYPAPLFASISVAPPPFVFTFTLRIVRPARIPTSACALSCTTVSAWANIFQSVVPGATIATTSPITHRFRCRQRRLDLADLAQHSVLGGGGMAAPVITAILD